MKPFLTVQTCLWAEWTEGSKQTKLGRTRSSPEESVPEAIRPSRRTFHFFPDLSFFKSYTTRQFFPCLIPFSYPFLQGEERGRARQEGGRRAGEVVSVGEVRPEDVTLLFANRRDHCKLSSPILSTDFTRRYSSWKGSTIHILMIFFVISNKPFL